MPQSHQSSKPAIVLVHGAWHVPQHYADLISRPKASGFEVTYPLLPSCDEKARMSADLDSDVETPVILLMHSYGGAVGTDAARGLILNDGNEQQKEKGGIVHLIYMCAFKLQVGESVMGASLPRPEPEPVEMDEQGTTFLSEPPRKLFYADPEPNVAAHAESLLVRQIAKVGAGEQTFAAWQHVPTTYLKCTEDEVLLPQWQQRQIDAVQNAGVQVDLRVYQSSHSPYLKFAHKIVNVVEEIAATIGRPTAHAV